MPGHLRALLCTTLIAVCTGFQPSIVRDVPSYRSHAMCPATTTSSTISSKTIRRFPRIAQHMAEASAGDSRMVWRQGFYLNSVWQRGRYEEFGGTGAFAAAAPASTATNMAVGGEMASAATKEPQKEQRAAAPVDIKSVLKVPWSKTGGFKLPEASAKTEGSKAALASSSFDPKSLLKVPWSETGGFKLPEAGAKKSSVPTSVFDIKSLLKVPWKSTPSSAAASPAEPFSPSALLKVPWSKTGGKKFLLPTCA